MTSRSVALGRDEDGRKWTRRLVPHLGGQVGAPDGAVRVVGDPPLVDGRAVGEHAQAHHDEDRLGLSTQPPPEQTCCRTGWCRRDPACSCRPLGWRSTPWEVWGGPWRDRRARRGSAPPSRASPGRPRSAWWCRPHPSRTRTGASGRPAPATRTGRRSRSRWPPGPPASRPGRCSTSRPPRCRNRRRGAASRRPCVDAGASRLLRAVERTSVALQAASERHPEHDDQSSLDRSIRTLLCRMHRPPDASMLLSLDGQRAWSGGRQPLARRATS